MDFNGVYHRANDNYCYAYDEDNLIINIKTGYDVKYVNLIHGDPFSFGILGDGSGWDGQSENIPYKKRLKNQIWWTTTIHPEFKRVKYYFELITETERWFYFEDGFVSEEQMHLEGRSRQCFVMPWMNASDIMRTPEWVNQTIWYQIFPERFCNGDPSRNPDQVRPWNNYGEVNNQEYYGGDLQGIIDKLDYIASLGVTGIYLTPIFLSNCSHKYATEDYTVIDPHFGDWDTLMTLVGRVHEKGMRIMLDGVFNHSGPDFIPWKDVLEKGKDSRYYNWFMVNKEITHYQKGATRKGEYYSFAFVDEMPKLNTNNPEVIEYFISVCERLVGECRVDGIRLDVANELSHTFCKKLRERLKRMNPDVFILGEIWHDAMPWLRGDEFDSVMNYPLAQSIKDFWIDRSLKKDDFEYTVNRCYIGYMQQVNDVLFNLLDSHDTMRLRTATGSLDEYFQMLAILFAMPGSPCIYYGTEIAMAGGHDPDNRRIMPWCDIEEGKYDDCIAMVTRLINVRKSEELMRSRDFFFPDTIQYDHVIEFRKVRWPDDYVEVIINCENLDITIEREGEILFERHYLDNQLLKNGILIRRIKNF